MLRLMRMSPISVRCGGVLAAVLLLTSCASGSAGSPASPESQEVTIQTPCGPVAGEFFGRMWVRDGDLDPQYGDPVWHGPEATGTVSRLAEDRVRFVGRKGQSAEFRPLPAGEAVGLCG